MEAEPVIKYYWPLMDDPLAACRGNLWFIRYLRNPTDKLELTGVGMSKYVSPYYYNIIPDALLLLRGIETTLYTTDGGVYEFTD